MSEQNGAPVAGRPFDLATLRALQKREDDGIDVHVKDLNGLETDFVVRMAGPDSLKVTNARLRLADARLKAGRINLNAGEIEQEQNDIVAAAILGWTGLSDGGQEVKFDPDIARKIIAVHRPIRDQLLSAVLDRSLFMTG